MGELPSQRPQVAAAGLHGQLEKLDISHTVSPAAAQKESLTHKAEKTSLTPKERESEREREKAARDLSIMSLASQFSRGSHLIFS